MAKNKTEKEFNFKLYAVVVFFAVLISLVAIVYTTFTSRYIAFDSRKVAETYVDTIVQTGDGYNAYKLSLLSKNGKYGDFIRKQYMYPLIEKGAKDEEITGFNHDSYKGEKTLNDDGSLQGKLIDTMYPFYEKLIAENGWDNYDLIFTSYFDKLIEERKAIFGDDYMSDEVMFTALEANVRTYGEKLTGTEDEFDENTGLQTSVKSEGLYEKAFGEDYRITTVSEGVSVHAALEPYLAEASEKDFEMYGISKDDISDHEQLGIEVVCGEKRATVNITVVKIGKSWYVDPSCSDTSELYEFYKNS